MPNIIEQQDLLKGLPDNRLALLLRNPDATIPPFLVAAEAQRRQAIRQQFAGDAGKESVVDSLTKQLANVPQNVQAPMQIPPRMPAPMMPQAGIAALQQAPAQAPVQPPQQMAGGGAVLASQAATAQPWDYGIIPKVYDYIGSGFGSFSENARKFGLNPTAEQRQELSEKSAAEAEAATEETAPKDSYVDPFVRAGRRPAEYTPPPPKPVDPSKGTVGTSAENRDKAESAKYRGMLEELYAAEEPSNWEEAQKWFAMSAQIMNPDANLMQGLVNAGAVYSEAEAEQAAAKRAGELEMKKALLQYDISERDYARELAARDAEAKAKAAEKLDERQWRLKERMIPEASSAISSIGNLIEGIDKRLEDPMLDATIRAELLKQRQGYEIQLANIMKMGGFSPSGIVTRDQLGI